MYDITEGLPPEQAQRVLEAGAEVESREALERKADRLQADLERANANIALLREDNERLRGGNRWLGRRVGEKRRAAIMK